MPLRGVLLAKALRTTALDTVTQHDALFLYAVFFIAAARLYSLCYHALAVPACSTHAICATSASLPPCRRCWRLILLLASEASVCSERMAVKSGAGCSGSRILLFASCGRPPTPPPSPHLCGSPQAISPSTLAAHARCYYYLHHVPTTLPCYILPTFHAPTHATLPIHFLLVRANWDGRRLYTTCNPAVTYENCLQR